MGSVSNNAGALLYTGSLDRETSSIRQLLSKLNLSSCSSSVSPFADLRQSKDGLNPSTCSKPAPQASRVGLMAHQKLRSKASPMPLRGRDAGIALDQHLRFVRLHPPSGTDTFHPPSHTRAMLAAIKRLKPAVYGLSNLLPKCRRSTPHALHWLPLTSPDLHFSRPILPCKTIRSVTCPVRPPISRSASKTPGILFHNTTSPNQSSMESSTSWS